MNCKKLLNREFITKHCAKTFCNGEYKNHREKVLLEREKILMPQTQPFVTREIKARAFEQEFKRLNEEINTLYARWTWYRSITSTPRRRNDASQADTKYASSLT